MPKKPIADGEVAARVRQLAETLVDSGLVRLRIERETETFEVMRASSASLPVAASDGESAADVPAEPSHAETIRAGLVGVLRMGRPAPHAGEVFNEDRELGYIEALGIRNPVRSLGGGKILAVLCGDGEPVEYGQPLFQLDRG
jgi:acetyl-CoA carboxylase biotin carboxyl carrier protein